MKSSVYRLRAGATALAIVILVSVIGYRILGWEWLDAFYMVVITVATVGFGESSALEPVEQVWTIAVMVVGITLVGYTFGGFLQFIAAGEFERAMGQRRMKTEIDSLKNHVIICGYGRMGRLLANRLKRSRERLLVIDQDENSVTEARLDGHLFLRGDATEEPTLKLAGIDRAKSLVTALPGDAQNVFITLTARDMNRRMQIIARSELETTEKKLIRAGADRVVAPASIGASRIASMIMRPSSTELLEAVSETAVGEIEIDEFQLPEVHRLVGKKLSESETRSHRLLVVAVRRSQQGLIFNPESDHTFQPNEVVIVMGRPDDIAEFRKTQQL